MDFSLTGIQQLDAEKIYEIILPTINKVLNRFRYMELAMDNYHELIIDEIQNSKKDFKGDSSYLKYIEDKITDRLSENIKLKLLNHETSIAILDNYINKKFVKINDYSDVIKYFYKFNFFIDMYKFNIDVDLLIDLMNRNTTFVKMIKIVMNEKYELMKSVELEKMFHNDSLISVIKTYCMLNDIKIKESELDEKIYDDTEITDSVQTYLNEIAKKPLLSIQQERELARKISEGDEWAKKIFIESNLRLVVNIAKKYRDMGMPFLDLIQEGNLGLMTAVDKYNVEKGYKFSTYATYWIKQFIIRSIANKGRNVRIPVYIHDKILQYKTALINLSLKLNRDPTINEIANEMGLPNSEIIKFQKIQLDTLSTSELVGNEEKEELDYFISSEVKSPEEIFISYEIQEEIRNVFRECDLKDREIQMLMLRYGFNDENPMTLEEIGKKYNITTERARQLEKKALTKIRNSAYITVIADCTQYPERLLRKVQEMNKDNKYRIPKTKNIYQFFCDYSRQEVDKMLSNLSNEEMELIKLRYENKLNDEEKIKFYDYLLPKMRSLLDNSKNELNSKQTTTRDNYIKLLEILKFLKLDELFNKMSTEKSMIILLKLGYVDGKCFSTQEISNFLGIDEKRVVELTNEVFSVNNSLNNTPKEKVLKKKSNN